jgi:hypothetical protein
LEESGANAGLQYNGSSETGRNVVYWIYLEGDRWRVCQHGTENNSIGPLQYAIYHWNKAFLKKLTAPQTVQKLSTFYGTRSSLP